MPVHDLRCDAAEQHVLLGEFRHRAPDNDDFGPCTHDGCTGTLHTYWGAPARGRKADAFVPVEVDGRRYDTREAWNGYLKGMQKSHPHLAINVEGASRAANRAEAEEVRHGLYRDNGIRNEADYHNRIREAQAEARGRHHHR